MVLFLFFRKADSAFERKPLQTTKQFTASSTVFWKVFHDLYFKSSIWDVYSQVLHLNPDRNRMESWEKACSECICLLNLLSYRWTCSIHTQTCASISQSILRVEHSLWVLCSNECALSWSHGLSRKWQLWASCGRWMVLLKFSNLLEKWNGNNSYCCSTLSPSSVWYFSFKNA